MPLLRGRRGDDGGTKYQMREKLFSIGDDYWIETDAGQRAFKVDGKALRLRRTLVLETPEGHEVFTIQEKKLSLRDKMAIERDGRTVATVRKALVTPLRDRFSVDVEGGEDMEAKGNIVDHEYTIERGGHKVAEASKRWFRVRDTYGIEIAEGQDDALILAITVCIDQMTRDVG
ncbi:MAG: LURP-one-related/scramblase family protein [Gaiellaceae bacterium]